MMNKEEHSAYAIKFYTMQEQIDNLQKKVDHYKHLYSEVKKQKADVVEYIKYNFIEGEIFYSKAWLKMKKKELLRMLGEIDVED